MSDSPIPVSIATDRAGRSARFFSHLHRYKNLLRKRWWLPTATILAGLAVQGARLWFATPLYIAEAQMVVNVKISPSTGTLATYTEEWNNFLGTQVELMKGRDVREAAIERVRELRPDLPPVPVELFVTTPPKTAIFRLAAIGAEPNFTRAYLDASMKAYLDYKRGMKTSTAEDSLGSIRKELERLEQEMNRGAQVLLDFKSSNSVVVLQEQGGKAGSYLADLTRQLAQLQTEYDLLKKLNLDQSLELQRKNLTTGPADNQETEPATAKLFGADTSYLQLKQKIQLKKAERGEWSKIRRPKHPLMITLDDEIARDEKLLDILRQQSAEQLENHCASLELRIQNLEKQKEEWEQRALDIGRKMAQYEKINAENERNKQLYNQLLVTMQSLNIGKGADPESVVISEKAAEARRYRPTIVRFLAIGALLGLVAGFGLLLGLDRLDDRVTSLTELQDLFDEATLGQIPHENPAGKVAVLKLLQADDARHAFAEAYRNLRSSILYMATEGKRAKTLLVTSAIPGEGKSLTAANLAIVLALGGARVLLVDGDLRKGLLHKHFSTNPSPGFTEALTQDRDGTAEAVATTTPNLSFLPRGTISKNPGEMFLKPSLRQLLEETAAKHDYVIIDSAPVMAADDVTSLAPHVEGVIFVIRAAYTSARVARAALDSLYQREVNVLGLVFNGIPADAAEYYFYKYKDYYTAYPST